MIIDNCLCKSSSLFKNFIEYKNETVFKTFNGFVIGKCTNCGLLKTFINKNIKVKPSHDVFYEENRRYFEGIFQPIVDKILQFKKCNKVLDVGCSSGIILGLLKKQGFDIYGVEPNKQAFQKADEKFKRRILYGFLAEFVKNNKIKFDVIIYNHVLEHIDTANEEIKLARSILKKTGLLVIGVPNVDNVIFYLRKKYWEPLMPAEHVWHFSKKNIINFLKKHGFNILDISFSDDKRKDYSLIKKVYFRFLSLINKLFGTGETILIIANRN